MKLETNGDYNPCQFNETINFGPDGKVLSKSWMFNLRGENPKEIWETYKELRQLIEKGESGSNRKAGRRSRTESKENSKGEKKDSLGTCPVCGGTLVEKAGISKKTGRPYHFIGCSNFPACTYIQNIPDEEPIPIADQDLISMEEVYSR